MLVSCSRRGAGRRAYAALTLVCVPFAARHIGGQIGGTGDDDGVADRPAHPRLGGVADVVVPANQLLRGEVVVCDDGLVRLAREGDVYLGAGCNPSQDMSCVTTAQQLNHANELHTAKSSTTADPCSAMAYLVEAADLAGRPL